jgi:anti-sigma regulatory factor (Ser/Thr protein kinase)
MAATNRTINITSSVENLEEVRLFISEIAEELGFEEHAAFEIELSLYEACANVIEHAYENEAGNNVEIEVDDNGDEMIIIVRDNGLPFRWEGKTEINISDMIATKQNGGLGLHIIEACIDRLDYERSDEQNVLKLFKKLPENQDEG